MMTDLEFQNFVWAVFNKPEWVARALEILREREDLIYHERVTKFDERNEFQKMEAQEGGD